MTATGSKYRAYQLDKLGSLDGLSMTIEANQRRST
jgi:hypothetical protein